MPTRPRFPPPRPALRSRPGALLLAILLGLPAGASLRPAAGSAAELPGSAEAYRLGIGDVIEIAVAGMPDMRQRLPVQMDGTVSYPHLGRLAVAGSTMGVALRQIQAVLSSQVYRQRLADGREITLTVEPRAISAAVVEYRPIYVSGDVARPGEQAFRPLMSVRQAVSVAGGYDLLRAGAKPPAAELADARGEQDSVSAELAKETANIARLRRELGEEGGRGAAADPMVPRPVMAELQRSQADLLEVNQADHQRERQFLRRSVEQVTAQSAVLSRQQRDEEQGVKVDTEDLDRLTGLLAKGAVVAQRVTEARRSLLLSSTRALQTTAQLMQATRQKEEIARQLERLEDVRRIKLVTELSERSIKAQQLRARLQALVLKIGGLAAGAGADLAALRRPTLHIIRRGEAGPQRLVADEDTVLAPGDVVDVALKLAPNLSALQP